METWIENLFKTLFYPILAPIFHPVDKFLNWVDQHPFTLGSISVTWASICGVGLFVCAMIWVGLILDKEYVNRGRPYKSIWTDLRLWTVISMTPHVLVYFYFTR